MKRTPERIRQLLTAYRMKAAPDMQYTVFNNNHMELLIEKMPKNLEELSSISGFPSQGNRVKKYGQSILNIINEEDEEEKEEEEPVRNKTEILPDTVKSHKQDSDNKSGVEKTAAVSVTKMNNFSKK